MPLDQRARALAFVARARDEVRDANYGRPADAGGPAVRNSCTS